MLSCINIGMAEYNLSKKSEVSVDAYSP
jgi:hypothetical protein